MKLKIPIVVFVLLLPATSYGQDLYFTILDSLDYNPTSIDIADFDGDSLDEIFAGSDTGLLVIDPRTHGIEYYSEILRERVTASAYFDVDVDGAKDLLIGTQHNGYWLNVIWGPEYDSYYRWGGYISAGISVISTGVRGDSENIMVQAAGLYSIDNVSWDYAYLSPPGNLGLFLDTRISFVPEIAIEYENSPQHPAWPVTRAYNSDLVVIRQTEPCEPSYDQNVVVYGAAAGAFIAPGSSYLAIVHTCGGYYDPPFGLVLTIYDMEFNIRNSNFDSSFENIYGSPAGTLAYDVDNNAIDDICIFAASNVVRVYDGQDLALIGQISLDSGISGISVGMFQNLPGKAMVFKMRDKIFMGQLSTEPQSVEASDLGILEPAEMSIYPNPFNAELKICLKVAHSCDIDVHIYNILGQKVATVYMGKATAGLNIYDWCDSSLPSGLYLIVVSSPQFMVVRKLGHLK